MIWGESDNKVKNLFQDYGEETAALDMLREYMKTQGVVS